MKITLGNIDVDKFERHLARFVTSIIDDVKNNTKKIQTNSAYGELRGKNNGKQK